MYFDDENEETKFDDEYEDAYDRIEKRSRKSKMFDDFAEIFVMGIGFIALIVLFAISEIVG